MHCLRSFSDTLYTRYDDITHVSHSGSRQIPPSQQQTCLSTQLSPSKLYISHHIVVTATIGSLPAFHPLTIHTPQTKINTSVTPHLTIFPLLRQERHMSTDLFRSPPAPFLSLLQPQQCTAGLASDLLTTHASQKRPKDQSLCTLSPSFIVNISLMCLLSSLSTLPTFFLELLQPDRLAAQLQSIVLAS